MVTGINIGGGISIGGGINIEILGNAPHAPAPVANTLLNDLMPSDQLRNTAPPVFDTAEKVEPVKTVWAPAPVIEKIPEIQKPVIVEAVAPVVEKVAAPVIEPVAPRPELTKELLLELWGMTAPRKNILIDQSGLQNHFEWKGNNPFISNTYAFDAISGAQSVDPAIFDNIFDAMTITAWVKFPEGIKNKSSIINRQNAWGLGIDVEGNKYRLNLNKHGSADQSQSIVALSDDIWYHLSAIQTDTSVTYFVNGKQQGNPVPSTQPFVASTGDVFIGNDVINGLYGPITYGQITIWNYAKTSTDITKAWNSQKTFYGYKKRK